LICNCRFECSYRIAREFAPNAKLYINDFDTTNTTKRQFLHDLVVDLQSRGIPIDGIGHQMHNNVDFPSGQAIMDTINMFYGLGIDNQITELDVSVYSNSFPNSVTDYADIPADRFLLQGYRYRTFFDAFRQLQGKISSITFWGQADDHTWLTSAARVNAPLLFDTSLKKKLAYWGIIDPLQLPGADVSTTISADSAAVQSGQSIAYNIQVKNNADNDVEPYLPTDDDLPAANVTLVGTIPGGTTFQSLTAPTDWNCTTPLPGESGQVQCTTASLAVDASAQFTLNVAVSCAIADGSALVNSATVSSTTLDPNTAPNNTASANVTVSNPPPTITLNGTDTMTVECHTSFTDPGAAAADDCDGSVSVTTSGSVDVNVPGQYVLTYTAQDTAGNVATRMRTVNVVDTMAADCRSVRLRAERDVNQNGRVYTVTLRVRDASGNTTTRTAQVTVPNGQGIGAAVDDGPHYTVIGCP
jgi:hypothetical protein